MVGVIKNGQSRNTGNIDHTRYKLKKNEITQYYTQNEKNEEHGPHQKKNKKNDKQTKTKAKEGDIFCVFTRDLPVNSVVTAANSPAVLNSTGAAFSAAQSCYNISVNTQNISPSLSFITEINLSFMSITRSGIPQNGLLDTTLFWFMSCIKLY
jgi:hypothetical protein